MLLLELELELEPVLVLVELLLTLELVDEADKEQAPELASVMATSVLLH